MPQNSKPRVGLAGTLDLRKRGAAVAPLLCDILRKLDFDVTTSNEVDILININHNWKSINELTNPDVFKVLIRLEPAAVYPAQYSEKVMSKYQLIISPGMQVDEFCGFIPWPYSYQANPLRPKSTSTDFPAVIDSFRQQGLYSYEGWSKREIYCSMIAANKVSPNGTGNYSLRRKFALAAGNTGIQIYGELWKAGLLTKLRYRLGVLRFAIASGSTYITPEIFRDLLRKYPDVNGAVENKQTIVENSKFSLVIENSDMYVSEKLIDALFSGSIPVYFGPSLKFSPIAEDLVVRYSGPVSELTLFLQSLNPEQIKTKLAKIEEFIGGQDFLRWHQTEVYDFIAKQICLKYSEGK
jgi:hypothetical protein